MKVRRMFGAAAVAGLLLLTTACGGEGSPFVGGSAERPDGEWQLVVGEGPDGDVPILDSHAITLDIDGDEWGGTAACNSYGGTVEVDGSSVTVVELWQTEMACEPHEVMESEAAYLRALHGAETWDRQGDELTLTGPETRLVFEPAEG